MIVEFYRESPGKFDSRTLSRETLSRWTGRRHRQFEISLLDKMVFLLKARRISDLSEQLAFQAVVVYVDVPARVLSAPA